MSAALPNPPARKKGRRLLLGICGGALALFVLLVGAYFAWQTQIVIPRLQHTAEQRWAEIGRSMIAFQDGLSPVDENTSLKALANDLKPFGIRGLYDDPSGELDSSASSTAQPICALLDLTIAADQVEEARRVSLYLDEHARDLDRLYQGILQREKPVWNFNPQELTTRRKPSHLAIRQISQLICLDVLHRLKRGDEKSAAAAITAGWKMTENLGEQPTLTSFLIRANIENLFIGAVARLPEDPPALGQLSVEIEASRERWRKAIQGEAWRSTQVFEYLSPTPNTSLIQRTQDSITRSFMRRDCALFLARVAGHVRASEQVRTLAVSNLGANQMQESAGQPESAGNSDWFSEMWGNTLYGSWVRLNAILLRREQAQLVHTTRARLAAGESGDLGERESLVVPGAKWRVVADATTHSASLQLTPLPPWTVDSAIDPSFFLLPLDGSRSWMFRKLPPESPVGSLAVR